MSRISRQGVFILAVVALAPFCSPAAERRDPVVAAHLMGWRRDRLLVKPKQVADTDKLNALHASRGCRLLKRFTGLSELQVVSLPVNVSVEDALARYAKSGLVEFAERDYWLNPAATPNDPRYGDGTLWGLQNLGQNGGRAGADISAAEGWDILKEAPTVVVAVIDSGVRYTHEDLAANMWINKGEIPGNGVDDDRNGYVDDVHGIDAINGTGDPNDANGHGTMVAGIIGAIGNNRKGGVGVAWKVQIMACKYSSSAAVGSISDAIECIEYARLHGADIINASWGNAIYSEGMRLAIDRGRSAGIILVGGAGNSSNNNDLRREYPANYDLDNIVAVAAVNRSDGLWEFSNYGAMTVHLGAPGVAIYSTDSASDKAYAVADGTSLATPYVSGVLALVRAAYPNEMYGQLIHRVLAAVDPLPSLAGKSITGGRLNLQRALQPRVSANFTASRLIGAAPLEVEFRDTSLGNITSRQWNFGDNAHSTEASPKHTFASDGSFTVTLSIRTAEGLALSTNRTISVIGNYQIQAGNFNWMDPAGMTRISLGDNLASASFILPFAFTFYGKNYDRLYIGSNGLLGFSNQRLEIPSNVALPDFNAPNAIVCPYWDDLDPGTGGSVHFGVVGVAPNRRVVVSWVNVPPRLVPFSELTFQAILEETSNQIIFQYLEIHPDMSRGGGKQATIGLENDSGTVAAQFAFAGVPSLLSNRQSLVFAPQRPSSMPMPIAPSLRVDSTNSEGQFRFSVLGEAGKSYVIDASSDLLLWSAVSTNIAGTDGRTQFSEAISRTSQARFFRAR